ncbi:MAG: hypothetical protein ACTH8X_00985, partial [Corynebacterium variabile]
STVQSTLGGFLGGGSAGTGTIVHGRNHEGFVTAVDIVPRPPMPASSTSRVRTPNPTCIPTGWRASSSGRR